MATNNAHPDYPQGPSEVVMKLVFPYLHYSDLLKADIVCKTWRDVLVGDDVWRPVCDATINAYQKTLSNVRKNNPSQSKQEYYTASHEILVKQTKTRAEHGHSYREILLLSERMGEHILEHEHRGPEYVTGEYTQESKTLREAITNDFTRHVSPTISTLRQVFNDPDRTGRVDSISAMRCRHRKTG